MGTSNINHNCKLQNSFYILFFAFYKNENFYFCHLNERTSGGPQLLFYNAIQWEMEAKNSPSFLCYFFTSFDIYHFLAVSVMKLNPLNNKILTYKRLSILEQNGGCLFFLLLQRNIYLNIYIMHVFVYIYMYTIIYVTT